MQYFDSNLFVLDSMIDNRSVEIHSQAPQHHTYNELTEFN